MKRLLTATALTALGASAGFAQDGPVKIGIIFGFTGPIELLTPQMAQSAELALSEINESGQFLDGRQLEAVRADSTCIDSSAATAAAERLVSADGVVAIVGADCSGVTTAVLANVALPNGIPMISPSATSPALSTIEDNDLFFRTSPSDARQGEVLSAILNDRGISDVAVTYTNNDYGKGLADSFTSNFEAAGGTVTISVPHEDGKADYSAEVAALDSAGGELLAVFGYSDKQNGIMQAATDSGAFDTFVMGDGMYSDALVGDIGDVIEGSYGAVPSSEGEGSDAFIDLTKSAGINGQSSFTRESYNTAALLALAMQAGGQHSSQAAAANILNVANAGG